MLFEEVFILELFFFSDFVDNSTPQIIFSNRNEIRAIDLRTFSVKSLTMGLKNTVALDFYYFNSTYTVFWTDVIDDKIFKGTIDNDSELLSKKYYFSTAHLLICNFVTFSQLVYTTSVWWLNLG